MNFKFLILVCLLFTSACSRMVLDGELLETSSPKVLSRLEMTPITSIIEVGATVQLETIAVYTDNTVENVTGQSAWNLSQNTVASISNRAVVTGVAIGSTAISATYKGKVANCMVTVSPAQLINIIVTPFAPSIPNGTSLNFTATGIYDDASQADLTQTVTWSSGSTTLATIGDSLLTKGVAQALGVGAVTITATAGNISGSTTLTITNAVLNSISVTPANVSIANGVTQQFQATGTYSDATTRNITNDVTWSSQTITIATLSNLVGAKGLARTHAVGDSQVTATFGTVSGQTNLHVTSAQLVSMVISPNSGFTPKGVPVQFTLTGIYSDNSTQDLTSAANWSSSDSNILLVGNSPGTKGNANAVNVGSATLTATVGNTNASVAFQVTNATLNSIQILPNTATLPLGLTQNYQAIGTYSDASTADITNSVVWSVANSAVATISTSGSLVAVGTGTTQVDAALGAVAAQVPVSVTNAVLNSISISPANSTVALGLTEQLSVTGLYSDASTADLTSQVTWTTDDTTKAVVGNLSGNKGILYSVAMGTTTVRATLGAWTDSTPVTIAAPTLLSISVTPANSSVALGLTQQMTATGHYSNGSTADLTSQATWSSDTSATASINSSGLAQSHALGTTTLRASYNSFVGQTSITVTSPVLTSLTVTPLNSSIALGYTQNFTATGHYSDSSTSNLTSQVTWSSDATAVATVSSLGLANSQGQGTTNIRATFGSLQANTNLTVTAPVLVHLALAPLNHSIALGYTQTFTATGIYSDGSTTPLTSGVSWSSDNTAIATIASSGLATSQGTGSTFIRATVGSISVYTPFAVTLAALTSVTLSPTNSSVPLGYTQQLTATGHYSDGTTANITSNVTWTTDDSAKATVGSSTGVITPVATGTTTVRVTIGSLNAATQITVTPAILLSLALTPVNASLAKGLTQQYTATGTYSDATTANLTSSVTWSSDSTSIATLTSAGVMTAQNLGTTTLRASLNSVSANTNVTVTAPVLMSIAVTPTNSSLPLGYTQQLTAIGTYSDGSTANLTSSATWTTVDVTKATVGASTGEVSPVATGTTAVRATLGAIQGQTNITVTPAILISIVLTPNNSSIALGYTQQLTATGTYSDATTANLTSSVTWSSDNTAVATLNSAGLATSVGTGTTVLRATLGSVHANTNITITVPVLTSISLSPLNTSIALGYTQQMLATGHYSNGSTANITSSVTWSSNTTATATIHASSGLVTSVATGSTVLQAVLGSVNASTNLTVTAPVLTNITLSPTTPSIAQGLQQQITATGHYSNGTTADVTSSVNWSSDNATVATVGATAGVYGRVTGQNPGSTTIRATLGSISASTGVTITSPILTGIQISTGNSCLALGLTQQFSVTGTYSNSSTQNLTTSASYDLGVTSVASINSTGLLTSLTQGTVTVTATVGSFTTSTTVTVCAPVLLSISVTPSIASIGITATRQFVATGTYTNGTQNITNLVTWSASGVGLVLFNSTPGLALCVSLGNVQIKAKLGSIEGFAGVN